MEEEIKCDEKMLQNNDCNENERKAKTNGTQTQNVHWTLLALALSSEIKRASKRAYYMLSSSSSSESLVPYLHSKSYHGIISFELFKLLLKFLLYFSNAFVL